MTFNDRNEVFYYCASPNAFSYRGVYTTCPAGYVLAPYYKFGANSYNATFTIN